MAWTTPKTDFSPGNVLTAAQMNDIGGNLNELRNTPTALSAQDTTTQTGTLGNDFTYTTAEITLTPGTWMVQGQASLINTVTADSTSASLWNQTTGAEVANSTGARATTSTTMENNLVTRLTLITVTVNTAIRVRCKRNGGSTIRAASTAGAPAACLNAYRLIT